MFGGKGELNTASGTDEYRQRCGSKINERAVSRRPVELEQQNARVQRNFRHAKQRDLGGGSAGRHPAAIALEFGDQRQREIELQHFKAHARCTAAHAGEAAQIGSAQSEDVGRHRACATLGIGVGCNVKVTLELADRQVAADREEITYANHPTGHTHTKEIGDTQRAKGVFDGADRDLFTSPIVAGGVLEQRRFCGRQLSKPAQVGKQGTAGFQRDAVFQNDQPDTGAHRAHTKFTGAEDGGGIA